VVDIPREKVGTTIVIEKGTTVGCKAGSKTVTGYFKLKIHKVLFAFLP
jgi:hypothetical protein